MAFIQFPKNIKITRPKDECHLRSLENSLVLGLSKFYEKPCIIIQQVSKFNFPVCRLAKPVSSWRQCTELHVDCMLWRGQPVSNERIIDRSIIKPVKVRRESFASTSKFKAKFFQEFQHVCRSILTYVDAQLTKCSGFVISHLTTLTP